jgi:hypothetical protein
MNKLGLKVFDHFLKGGLMVTKRFISNVLALMAIFAFVGGCAKCYKVTDTSTNTEYYTHHVDRTPCGMVEFHDLKTQDAWSFGEKIRLQSAQANIEEMPKCNCRFQTTAETPCPKSLPKPCCK